MGRADIKNEHKPRFYARSPDTGARRGGRIEKQSSEREPKANKLHFCKIIKEEFQMMKKYGPYLMPNKWAVTHYNYVDEVRGSFNLPERFHVRDTTIREGDETPGVYMTPKDKLRIAERLFDAGVREAEIGYVGPAQEHYEAAKLIKRELPDLKFSGFARAWAKDWKRDVDRCVEAGAYRVDVLQHPILNWASDEQLKDLGCPRENIIPRTVEVIQYAKNCGVKVGYGHSDVLRTDWEYLKQFYSVVERAGVDRAIIYEDGFGAPPAVRYVVGKLRKLLKIPMLIHCHDDLGLGTANTLAAVEAGAEYGDLVVNGLGDRGGLCIMEEVVVNLECHYGVPTGINLEKLYGLSKFVEEITGIKNRPNTPVVGENCYIHESELHIYCIIKGLWEAMEPVKAETVGQKRTVVFGGTSLHGEAARARLDVIGVKYNDDDVDAILDQMRKVFPRKRYLTMEEFDKLARETLEKKP